MTTIKTDEKGTRELKYYDKAIQWYNNLENRYIAIGKDYYVYPLVDDKFEEILNLILKAPEDEKRMIVMILVSNLSRSLMHLKFWMDTYNKEHNCDKPITSFFYDR